MARLRRYCPAGIPVHVIQRGNNRQDCFRESQDKAAYHQYLQKASNLHALDVHAWVFMSNHVHLLVTPENASSVSKAMQSLGRQYVHYFNKKYSRTGTLWEGRFKSCLVQTEKYFMICQRYIELNPVRAGLAPHPLAFHWSSYKANALGVESELVTPHEVFLSLGRSATDRQSAYRALFGQVIQPAQLELIRETVNSGL
ncbi:MAG TPA: transposase, partial [Gammaproteobacteria bacterium]